MGKNVNLAACGILPPNTTIATLIAMKTGSTAPGYEVTQDMTNHAKVTALVDFMAKNTPGAIWLKVAGTTAA